MNRLHEFLNRGFQQAIPIIGEEFDYGSDTDLDGFFTQADEATVMQLVGEQITCDTICTAAIAQFTTPPVEESELERDGRTYVIKRIRSDLSAYQLFLSQIKP